MPDSRLEPEPMITDSTGFSFMTSRGRLKLERVETPRDERGWGVHAVERGCRHAERIVHQVPGDGVEFRVPTCHK